MQEIRRRQKFVTKAGQIATVENISGEWARVAVRLRPRQIIRQMWKVADVQQEIAAGHTRTLIVGSDRGPVECVVHGV